MTMSNVPDCVGVPESVADESGLDTSVKPDGNPVADQVKGGENEPPDAVNVCVGYNTPLVPPGKLVGEIRTRIWFSRF